MGFVSGQELGEQVWRLDAEIRRRLSVGKLWESLSHAVAGKPCHGEGSIDEAPLRELEVDWVLEKKPVKERDLTNLETLAIHMTMVRDSDIPAQHRGIATIGMTQYRQYLCSFPQSHVFCCT
jgi:hypothetical protein